MVWKFSSWVAVLTTRALPVALAAAVGLPSLPVGAAEPGMASVTRGGRLFDNWYAETRQRPPSVTHPAYAGGKFLPGGEAATWRCVACHGWDYAGRGKGTDLRPLAGGDAARVVAVLKDAVHGYGSVLTEQDMADLAAFVTRGQIDMAKLIDRSSGRSTGQAANGRIYFQTICANCHGYDGLALGTIPPLGDLARDNPWMSLHNLLNGHAGARMPALRIIDGATLAGILAYMQTLPTVEPLLSVVRGGRLYDNWIVETGAPEPTLVHPSYPLENRIAERDAGRTWRCKECHGWDYKGRDGVYASGNHYTGIKGIRGMAGAPPQKVMAILNDENHRFGRVLQYRDLMDLANFVSAGQVDMDEHIDRSTRKVKGDARSSRAFYDSVCASCHGEDGTRVPGLAPLGRSVNANPWSALHSVVNGHPGEEMPALRGLDMKVLRDVLAYCQTLPQ